MRIRLPRKEPDQIPGSRSPIAFCPYHGAFPVTGHILFPGAQASFRTGASKGSISFTCQRCGMPAKVIEGLYTGTKHGLDLLVAESIDADELVAIIELAKRMQAGSITLRNARIEAREISPRASKLFNPSTWGPNAKAVFTTTIATTIIAAASHVWGAYVQADATRDAAHVQADAVRDSGCAQQRADISGELPPMPDGWDVPNPRIKPNKP